MSDDLLIKISADAKDVKKAFDNVKEQTADLENALSGIAKVSGVAFAALTAQVALSVKIFSDSHNATLQLTNALQNQGIYTDTLRDSYKAYAEAISASTGISTIQITQAQTIAQQYLGQIPITQKLTQAIVDYSIKAGSTATAAEDISKAIGNGTGMLLRQGLQLSATSTEAERYAQVLDFINAKYGGQATALDPVTLATKKLGTAFEENETELGQRFAPAAAAAIDAITGFIKPAKDSSGVMVDLKADLIGAGLAISAVGVGLPVLANGFLIVRAAMVALNTQLTLTQALLAGLGIGLVAIALTELVLHFGQVSGAVKAFIHDLGQLANVAGGVGKILQGAFTFNADQVKAGLKEIGDAFKHIGSDVADGWESANKETEKGVTGQIAIKKQLADKEAALQREQDANRIAQDKAQRALVLAELKNESDAVIQLKKEELATLQELGKKNSAEEKALLQARLAQIRADEKAQMAEDKKIQEEFYKQQATAISEHGNDKAKLTTEADKKQLKDLQKNTLTAEKAQKKVYLDDLKAAQTAHNQFLEEQIKYGTAYAAINRAMHSAVYEGSKQAFGDLAELQQSSNSTLKEVGKIAAVANIVMKTAESAMNIYAGFSTIPIIGPELGIAGAAAAVAFGAEQVGKVTAAQTGALVDGSGYGDKYPYMLEKGELVAPRKSFDEVVKGVAQERGYSPPGSDSAQAHSHVVLSLKDDLMDFIEAKIVQRKNLNLSLQGSR